MCVGENWNRFGLSLTLSHLARDPLNIRSRPIRFSIWLKCLIWWQMSEPILSSWFRISEGGVNCVLLGNIFERQALPLMMSSSGSRETMVKLLARPAKLGGNSTYLSSLEHFPPNKPTCRWGVCRRRGQCRRHQSSKVLVDRLTRHHNNTPVINDEHLKMWRMWILYLLWT